jgi:NAD(P)H dehydrogenase (quinone)
MHCLIVLAHPEEKSFNAQMARVAKETFEAQGHTAELCDLYREGFDPCEALRHFPEPVAPDRFNAMTEQRHAAETGAVPPEVGRALERLERADLLLLQFPMWWFSVPAILKGWLDRVFLYGRVYTSKARYDRGYFRGKRALISVTAGAPASAFGPDGRCGDIDLLYWPLQFSLHYVGFTVLPPFYSYQVGGISDDPELLRERLEGQKAGLRRHLARLNDLEPLRFNGWDDWDENGRLRPGAPSYSPFMRHVA